MCLIAPKYIKQNITELKEEIGNSITVVEDFNTISCK